MGEQLPLFTVPAKRATKAKPEAAPSSPCCAAPTRPDGTLWPTTARRCTKPAGHDDAHENTAGDVWSDGDVLTPCAECSGVGFGPGGCDTCEACEGTGRKDEEVCGG